MIFGILQTTRLFSSIQNGIKDKRNKLVSDQKFDKTCGDFLPPKSAIFLAS
jgi:hypothetical protein